MRGKLLLIIIGLSVGVRAQELAFSSVKKLNSFINSDCEEILPLRSPDGKKIFFVRTTCARNKGGVFAGSDIWVSNYDLTKSDWDKPVNEGYATNDKGNNAVVGVNADGTNVYMMKTTATERIKGIYVSELLASGWSSPELVPIPFLESQEFFGVYVSPDFDLIIISMTGTDSRGAEDLYISTRNGEGDWSAPLNLGSTINTAGYEISPFVTADKKRIYFASNGHDGMGDADIFYSDRMDDSWKAWSLPVNMGNKINSKKFDAYFSLYDTVAYFSSNRSSKFSDIYQATLPSPVDSTEIKIKRIVGEAQSIIADLNGNDNKIEFAPGPATKSTFLLFPARSVVIDGALASQLDQVSNAIKNSNIKSVALVAHLNDVDSETQPNDLWQVRLEAVRDYLEKSELPNLEINLELKKHDSAEWTRSNGTIEIVY